MNPWQVATIVLTLVCICCFCTFADYKIQTKQSDLAYEVLLEEYKEIEKENELLKNHYKEMIESELVKIDEYILWKENLTALHQASVPDIEITDYDRQEFWKNYFICKNINTTLEE